MPTSPPVKSEYSSKTSQCFAPVSTQILTVGKWAYKSRRRKREKGRQREGEIRGTDECGPG